MRKLKRLSVLLLTFTLCLSSIIYASAADIKAEDFEDYDPGKWYAPALSAAVDNGLLIGNDENMLDPTGHLTRAEMAAVVNRAFGAYVEGDISIFNDVPENAWYYKDISMAYHMGTYEGTGKDTMSPKADISRQEVMTMISRALQLDTERYSDVDLTHFNDHEDISGWAVPYVKAMVGAGYVHGDGSSLNPKDDIIRAEFAQIFMNIIKKYITEPGTYTGDRIGNLLIRTDDVALRDMTIDGDLIIGCGVSSGEVTLDNVAITGRVVVWGGGVDGVYMDNGTDVPELVVCRVDGPVKVIFDRASTMKVYDKIDVVITERAEAFEETEVIFYDLTGISGAQDDVNDTVEDGEILISVPADMYATVDDSTLIAEIHNGSAKDTYRITVAMQDTGDAITDAIEIDPGETVKELNLLSPLPAGDYPCTVTVTSVRDGEPVGTLELEVIVHSAYLWNI